MSPPKVSLKQKSEGEVKSSCPHYVALAPGQRPGPYDDPSFDPNKCAPEVRTKYLSCMRKRRHDQNKKQDSRYLFPLE